MGERPARQPRQWQKPQKFRLQRPNNVHSWDAGNGMA